MKRLCSSSGDNYAAIVDTESHIRKKGLTIPVYLSTPYLLFNNKRRATINEI